METRTIYIHFLNHILFYVIVLSIVIVGSISYYRFIIEHDYIVEYEGVCDPFVDKCFIGCEDDACTREYYYSKVQKYEPDLYVECGKDITDCEVASVCLTNDRDCSIVFCDPSIDGDVCKVLDEKKDTIQNNDQVIPMEEGDLLQNNEINNKNI